MKLKTLLLTALFFAGAVSAFAGTNKEKVSVKSEKAPVSKDSKQKVTAHEKSTSCKVTVTYKNDKGKVFTSTVETTCDCTQKEACDAAYALASIAIS